MKKILLLTFVFIGFIGQSQDTTIVQTLTFDSTARAYMFKFPDGTESYRKVVMQYRMRCTEGLVSTGSSTNLGCGEWDYSCNTFITDSTRTDSIKATHPDYLVSGFSGTTFNYTSQPTYTYYQSTQQDVIYTTVNSETEGVIGTGVNVTDNPFGLSTEQSKTQYLITATELTNSGLIAGELTGLKLNISNLGDIVDYLKINLKSTTKTVLNNDTPDLVGFSNVYYLNTTFTNTGDYQFNFHNNFNWDGTSNIIIEFVYNGDAGNSNDVLSETILNHGINSNGNDFSLAFSGAQNVVLTNPFPTISDQITISFWSNGDSDLPHNTTIFEAKDANGNRQLNLHLPWENGSIYWDSGNDNAGYDRINKAASASEYKGKWNHWAVTKNTTTGSMKIYLNGVLWHSGNGKTKMMDISEFVIGSAVSGGYGYNGQIDEFRVWNIELSSTEINNYMYKSVTAAHPNYSNLLAYYKFNEGTGSVLTDEIGNHNGAINNYPVWNKKAGEDLFLNFIDLTERPNFKILQGDYVTNVISTVVLDSILNGVNAITEYTVNGSDLVELTTITVYESGNMSIYNESGSVVGNVPVATESTITINTLNYYNKYPSKYELMSFVTPYGIGLDLGDEGVMWEFDMTDYLPVLKNNRFLSVEFGKYQEELDIRFLFIEGTPSREVINIQNIWRAGQSNNYTNIMNDVRLEPRDISLNPLAEMYKIRAAITGHGQEGEFIPRTHYFNINGGGNEVEWQVWKSCGLNPIFPQGGTWVYDRAGWCPGMATDVKEYEINPSTITGNTVNIDYGVTAGSGDSRYIISSLLVQYGSPNFTNDASIIDIINPGKKTKHLRENPACVNPVITIKNTGSADLTSLKIEYKVSGGATESFNWTGNLSFLKTEKLELPISGNGFWAGDDTDRVIVTVSLPNGVADESSDNNTLSSAFEFPDWYGKGFIIHLKTNNNPNENSYLIKDVQGNIVHSASGFEANTQYKDTIALPSGCYMLEFVDLGGNGLNWWAAASQGAGYFKLKSIFTGWSIKTFESDFGAGFKYGFTIGEPVKINEFELSPIEFVLYPNPTSDKIFLSLNGLKDDILHVKVTDIYGKSHFVNTYNTTYNMEFDGSIDVSTFSNGVYFVEVVSGDKRLTKRIVVNK